MIEVNALAETLRDQRLGALEATTLLRTVMAEIDVAVFTFDEEHDAAVRQSRRRAAARPDRRSACSAGAPRSWASRLPGGEAPRVINTAFPGGVGRWEVRRSHVPPGRPPARVLVLSDLSQPLREEERQAWQRLIRVIGHEMNNSLAPIKSIAGSLSTIIEREPPPTDWRDDMQRGLAVIASRSESLSRFMSAYARLAQAAAAASWRRSTCGAFVDRVVDAREARTTIQVDPGPAS